MRAPRAKGASFTAICHENQAPFSALPENHPLKLLKLLKLLTPLHQAAPPTVIFICLRVKHHSYAHPAAHPSHDANLETR